MKGFHNKVLHINLNQQSFKEEHIDDAIYQQLLGGKGLGAHLLMENTKAGVDPLSAESVIVFATGPATDGKIYGSCRFGAFAKSPLTGLFGESYSGGTVAEPLSRTGYDAIVIKGISPKPVYLEISPNRVLFHDASHLWGKDTYETEDAIREEVGVKGAGAIVIGPAGENLVKFALIENNYWRSLGRTGMGAVMGSKKVKGIAFYGDVARESADPDRINRLWEELKAASKDNLGVKTYFEQGTIQMVPVLNKIGALPTKYWHAGSYDKGDNLTIDALKAKCNVRAKACPKCFMACGNLSEVLEGRHRGLKVEGPEFETIYSFGSLCLIDDITEVVYLNDICDRLGIDTMSAGNLAAFTIEASQKGAIKEKLDYGDVDNIADLLHKMVYRDGIGDTLAEGIRHAAKEWGLEELAIHVKGLEPSGYEPRILKGMGLAFAVSDRGACHLRSTVYKAELSGLIPPDQVEGKAEWMLDFEDRHTLFDALILCRFFRDFYNWERLAILIEATTGMKLDKKGLQKMALDITNKAREFNLREGMTEADDTLPQRFFEEKLEDSGKILPKAEFDRMLADYYRLKGWA